MEFSLCERLHLISKDYVFSVCNILNLTRNNDSFCFFCFVLFCLFVCLFVCLGFIIPLENLTLIWSRHHYRWKAANFWPIFCTQGIDQWGFFSLPNLLWHVASVNKGHIRGPVTLTPIAEGLAVNLSLPFLRLSSDAFGIRTPSIPLARPTLLPSTAAVASVLKELFKQIHRYNMSLWYLII